MQHQLDHAARRKDTRPHSRLASRSLGPPALAALFGLENQSQVLQMLQHVSTDPADWHGMFTDEGEPTVVSESRYGCLTVSRQSGAWILEVEPYRRTPAAPLPTGIKTQGYVLLATAGIRRRTAYGLLSALRHTLIEPRL